VIELPDYGVDDPVEVPVDPVANPLAGMPSSPAYVLPSSPGSFFRLVGAPPSRVDRWWPGRRVEVEHRLRIDAVRDDGGGARSLTGALRRPVVHRWVPIEIVLCPHLGALSRLTLNPSRRVRASRWWFRSGHRALERLARDLSSA
jgi:hypothetical protein